METRGELISALFSTVGRFRRQVRRTASRAAGESSWDGLNLPVGLTESQAELLRLVGRQPGISVSQAATELSLAANTASTLVSKLATADLLTREADPEDRRVGRLHLTESAQRVADTSRAARRAALAAAIDDLEDDEISALSAGLEVIAKMTRILQERAQ